MIPSEDIFRSVSLWCQEYLELQHSRDVGRVYGELLRVLGQIAFMPRDGVDRFDWLKAREEDVTRLLGELAIAHEQAQIEHSQATHRETEPQAGGRTKLFVYGTLKRGYSRASALDGQRFLGPAKTAPRYRMYDCGGYPGLVEIPDGDAVEGELYEVDATCLAALDEIEGVALNLYRRGTIALAAPFGDEEVESYFYVRSTRNLPDGGPRWARG